jgi:6-pyruvoyltetrahydropterin/6-carboxytetrahydropterin synthase
MIIYKDFEFDSAHSLPKYKGACHRLHGHHYYLRVYVEGEINPKTGMVIDFKKLSNIVKKRIINKYDHQYLNRFFRNPTAEIMVEKILETLSKYLDVVEVRLWETPTSCAIAKKDGF